MNLSPDWVEAIGTWVGGIGTVGTLIYASRALRHETERRRQDIKDLQEAERSAQDAQARTVVLHNAGASGREFLAVDEYLVKIGNYGEYPITNVISELAVKETGQVIVHANGWARGGQAPLAVLKPGASELLRWDTRDWNIKWPVALQSEQLPELFDLIVKFTDVHGIRWALRPGLGQQPARDYEIEGGDTGRI